MSVRSDTTQAMKRRGILAAAGAALAGIVAKQASATVAAVAYNLQGDTGLSIINVAHDRTLVIANGTFPTSTPVFDAELTGGNFTIGADIAAGVKGASNRDAGVWGVTAAASKPGVYGTSISGRTGIGVQGMGDAAGVIGQSFMGTGVQGSVPGSNFSNTVAVQGLNQSTGANGVGVYGSSANGTGIYGQTGASNQYGVLGATTATNSTAIGGIANTNGSSAFSGGTTNPNAFAAFFQGTVVVQGNFAVTGNKSAVVQHPRTGDYRLVYCVESPESYFEDFGEGTLAGGKASVTLDPDYAAIIHTDHYHVFLTSHDPTSKGLAVATRTAGGFVVQEHNGGTSNGTFSWRVVGKRADVKGERLGKFTLPNLPLPDPSKFKAPEVPTPAAPPKKP